MVVERSQLRQAVFGAGGGLGRALVTELARRYPEQPVLAVSRGSKPDDMPTEVSWHQVTTAGPEGWQQLLKEWQEQGIQLSRVISTVGWLHQGEWQPEKSLNQLDEHQLLEYFRINAIWPTLLLEQLKPLLPRKAPATVVQLGAKVGSIGDNRLGGWYGYRASKAALNMLWRTAAIELRRTHKQLCIGVVHPGTTDTELSEPFQKRLPADKLYSPELSAERIIQVVHGLTPDQSGGFWFWDGEPLPW